MRIIQEPTELRREMDAARQRGERVGFVPTMGALHQGHLSLCRTSQAQNDLSVVSIFVNPLQFAPSEDFSRYPRVLAADRTLLQGEGVAVVFAPSVDGMYPAGFQTRVEVKDLSETWEGVSRPGHFNGVATVVLKLLNQVGPCRAYFGEKDYQQLQIIRRMTLDLDVPVEVVPQPTVRELDGLAMSSRNRYLSPEERAAAPGIYRALTAAQEAARAGERDARSLVRLVEDLLAREPLFHPDYVALVDQDTLEPLTMLEDSGRLLTAVRLGATRLIDNVMIDIDSN